MPSYGLVHSWDRVFDYVAAGNTLPDAPKETQVIDFLNQGWRKTGIC